MNKLLWLAPFATFIAGYAMMSFLFKTHVVQTPSIIGKNIQEAMRIAAKQGLSIKLIDEKDDPEIPSGLVISQIPHANALIKVHQPISCIISKKTTKITPSCVGLHLDQIQENCKKLGITCKILSTSKFCA